MKYYWSRFVHMFVENDIYCLLHTVKVRCIYTKKKFLVNKDIEIQEDVIRVLGTNFFKALVLNGYIITDLDEDVRLIKQREVGLENVKLCNLRILVSNACNMDCTYCQIEKNIKKDSKVNMQKEVAEKALNYFFENRHKGMEPTVNITGGEPLLNYEVVRYIVKRSRETLPSCRLVMFTNATLVTDEIADFLKENGVFTIVSIDGPSSVHNQNRIFKNGNPSYDSSIQGYQILKQHDVKCGISAVLDGDLQSFKDTLYWLCKLRPESVGMNYRHSLLKKDHIVNFEVHSKNISYARKILLQHGIFLENYERYRKKFLLGKMRLKECQACGTGMTVDARGLVGTCKSLLVSDKIIFDLDTFDIYSNATFREWAKRTPLHFEECQNCSALSICGGGCAYDSYLLHDGGYWFCDKRLCVHMQNIVRELIWENFKEMNLAQHEFWIWDTQNTNMMPSSIGSVGH